MHELESVSENETDKIFLDLRYKGNMELQSEDQLKYWLTIKKNFSWNEFWCSSGPQSKKNERNWLKMDKYLNLSSELKRL